jgi:hypothetical protein
MRPGWAGARSTLGLSRAGWLTVLGWRWAAVLACGGPDRSVHSHQSAAAMRDLLPLPAKSDSATLGAAHGTATIRVHRCALHPDDITAIDGLH